MSLLWFNFILGLNFIFFCFKLSIIHYHTQKQRKMKFKPRIKLNHNITITNTDPTKKNVYPWWPEDIGYQFLLSIHIHATKEFTLCRAFGYHKHKFPLKIDQGFLITREAINIRKNISILLVLISLKLDLANRSMNLWWHSDNCLRLL